MSTNNLEVQDRVKRQKEVKQKIQSIMQSVKQEKQFIENKLATNDHKIQLYCQEYESLKQLNDFSQLKHDEQILLHHIAQGLQQNAINPKHVIGGQEVGLKIFDHYQAQGHSFKPLTNQQIIAVQTLLIDKLATQLKLKQKHI